VAIIDRDGVPEPIVSGRVGKILELKTHLNTLHDCLKKRSQDLNPDDLQKTADRLISSKFLDSKDQDVRLLSVYCIVDILKFEYPYSDEDMVRIFEEIISQIRRLSEYDIESETGKIVAYVLESISSVNSCVIPVTLEEKGVPGAESLVNFLFDALISGFNPKYTEDGEFLVVFIALNIFSAIHASFNFSEA
jgi:hypothetical protein